MNGIAIIGLAKEFEEIYRPGEAAPLPPALAINAPQAQSLRYGENPHQRAALYGKFGEFFLQLHGKELSYNNILDLTAATALITEFTGDAPTGPGYWHPVMIAAPSDPTAPVCRDEVFGPVAVVSVGESRMTYPLLAEFSAAVGSLIGAAEKQIVAELVAVQGKPADIGGYYQPDDAKASAALRPSATLNAIIDAI